MLSTHCLGVGVGGYGGRVERGARAAREGSTEARAEGRQRSAAAARRLARLAALQLLAQRRAAVAGRACNNTASTSYILIHDGAPLSVKNAFVSFDLYGV